MKRLKNGVSVCHTQKLLFIDDDELIIDDEVATAGTLTEGEIIDTVIHGIESDDIDEDLNNEPQDPPTIVSISEARRAVNTLRSYKEQCTNTEDYIFASLFNIENKIDVESVNCLKQKKYRLFYVE